MFHVIEEMIDVVGLTPAQVVGLRFRIRLSYDATDPFAVSMDFPYLGITAEAGDVVRWQFGRELLMTGMHRRAGCGDVQIWPDGQGLVVLLSSPDGSVSLRLPNRRPVMQFLDRSLSLVPRRAETIDWDREIAELLG